MNALIHFVDYWDRKVKLFGIVEIKLVQGATIAATLILVKLVPQILSLSIWWFVALLVICAVPVHYVLWFKNPDQVNRWPA